MKKLLILLSFVILASCVDQHNRYENLKNMYPKCKVEPATGLIQKDGYDFIVIDSSMQIIAVCYYPWSETKIMQFRNIR
jgi:hypothetical protein